MTVRPELVVNGDDFGLTPGVNAAMLDAHRRGVLTSVSLFANAPETVAAITLARRTATLGVGAHLALVDARPVLPPGQVATLLASDGRFRQTWKAFIADALRGRISLAEVERELAAQMERLADAGIRLTHLDAHKHVHAWPPVFAIVVRLARRFGVEVVRVPFERPPFRLLAESVGQPAARRQALENIALWIWTRRDRQLALSEGLRVPNFVGRVHTGVLTPDALERMLVRLPAGVSELMTHPGYPDEALRRERTRLVESRATEAALLLAPRTRALVDRHVSLVRHDLVPVASPELIRHAS